MGIVGLSSERWYAHLTPVGEGYVPVSVVAKNIRADLKKNFPGVKFQVRKDSESAISVRCTVGEVGCKEVQEFLTRYNKSCDYEDLVKSKATPFEKAFGGVDYVIFY